MEPFFLLLDVLGAIEKSEDWLAGLDEGNDGPDSDFGSDGATGDGASVGGVCSRVGCSAVGVLFATCEAIGA